MLIDSTRVLLREQAEALLHEVRQELGHYPGYLQYQETFWGDPYVWEGSPKPEYVHLERLLAAELEAQPKQIFVRLDLSESDLRSLIMAVENTVNAWVRSTSWEFQVVLDPDSDLHKKLGGDEDEGMSDMEVIDEGPHVEKFFLEDARSNYRIWRGVACLRAIEVPNDIEGAARDLVQFTLEQRGRATRAQLVDLLSKANMPMDYIRCILDRWEMRVLSPHRDGGWCLVKRQVVIDEVSHIIGTDGRRHVFGVKAN